MSEALEKIQNDLSLSQIGEVFFKSNLFSDIKSASQAIVKIMAGRELGCEPYASMSGFHIIQGKVEIGAKLISAKIKQAENYDFEVKELSDQACTLEFFGKNKRSGKWQSLGKSTYTIDDAKKAQVVKKDSGWDKAPRNMLFARAISNGQKWFAPDVFVAPVYAEGEISGVDPEEQESRPDEAPAKVITPEQPEPPEPPKESTKPGLLDTFKQYGVTKTDLEALLEHPLDKEHLLTDKEKRLLHAAEKGLRSEELTWKELMEDKQKVDEEEKEMDRVVDEYIAEPVTYPEMPETVETAPVKTETEKPQKMTVDDMMDYIRLQGNEIEIETMQSAWKAHNKTYIKSLYQAVLDREG